MSTEPIIFTQNAAAKVWELICEEGNLNLKLRVYVTGGGCSGFQYGFTFDEVIQSDDTVITQIIKKSILGGAVNEDEDNEDEEDDDTDSGGSSSVQLLIDPLSFQYLAGAEIDYKEDIEGEQFIIRNPQAKTTCGCGSSFAV